MFVARLLLALAVAAAAGVLVLREANVLPADTPEGLYVTAAWTVALGGVVAAFDSATQSLRSRGLAGLSPKLVKPMLALAQDVSTRTGVSLDHIGVAIWEPKWTRSGRRLICAGAERRGYKPAQSGIRWRVGKGVIGTCVKARKDAVADLEQLDEEFRKLTRREWNGLPRDERLGLRAREMERRSRSGRLDPVVAKDPAVRGSR